jgi:hypothetical protein
MCCQLSTVAPFHLPLPQVWTLVPRSRLVRRLVLASAKGMLGLPSLRLDYHGYVGTIEPGESLSCAPFVAAESFLGAPFAFFAACSCFLRDDRCWSRRVPALFIALC